MFTSLLILLIIILKSNSKATTDGHYTHKSGKKIPNVFSFVRNIFQRTEQKNIFVKNKHQPKVKNV